MITLVFNNIAEKLYFASSLISTLKCIQNLLKVFFIMKGMYYKSNKNSIFIFKIYNTSDIFF